ncbi:MAG: HAMP domain-containing histidine kinase [Acidimicrobiia bacterium]|nr:HAMP domain-containing histidine kinase [Acidimicrobiia bacterium]
MENRSIRFRITALATTAVAIALLVAGTALVLLQRSSIIATLDSGLTQRADDITTLVSSGSPVSLAQGSNEGFAQLVGPDAKVLISTANLAGAPPLDIGTTAEDGDVFATITGLPVDDDSFRVLTRRLDDIGVLHVGTTFDVVEESTSALLGALTATVPLLLVSLALMTWWLVGRTLRPVEDLRAQVAEIGATDLHRRVPQHTPGDEIDRLAATMNEMLSRLESASERQRHFVADASHELRSPLTRMRNILEVDISDPTRRDLAYVPLLSEVDEMQRLVEDLLALARLDDSPAELTLTPLDLDDLVLREARRLRDRNRVEVDTSGVSGALVLGDQGQLTRAIRNLLDNAERHAHSQVTLSVIERDGMGTIVVGDDGPGVPESSAQRIFERFARIDEARSGAGTGLGLAISRRIVETHGGSLRLVAPDREGAWFELRLPLAD